MENKKTLILLAVIVIALAMVSYFSYIPNVNIVVVNQPNNNGNNSGNTNNSTSTVSSTTIVYRNSDYGFNFTLPIGWTGYTVVNNKWIGNSAIVATATNTQTGPKLLIRNPKWTVAAPYEDIPVLVFTKVQWNMYIAEKFNVSAAPMQASELGRNNKYVFALPPRWDFDYSINYKEAQDIVASKPLKPFNLMTSQAKLNIDLVCQQAISYMKFADAKSMERFVSDCKDGKHPEVIERYKANMNLGDGAKI